MILNLQPDRLLLPDTKKEGEILAFRSRKAKGKYRLMRSSDVTWDGEVHII